MFYLYILKSKRDGQLYIGSTNDLRKRFKEHNEGKVFSTKFRTPFELIFYEAYKAEKDARKRESNLKLRSKAFAQLKKRITYSLKSDGGTPRGDFGVGSTPTSKSFGVGVNGSS
jgi:putative endonuclease